MKSFILALLIALFMQSNLVGQVSEIKLDPVKVEKFSPYMKYKHSWEEGGFEGWKNNNKLLYTQEMWYYTESFYIKRDHFPDGLVLNEDILDVSRFENQRKQNEEVFIRIVGFKDALVLIPANKLIYKPN